MAVKTMFITLQLVKHSLGSEKLYKDLQAKAELTTRVRPDEEKWLDEFLQNGWEVIHTSQFKTGPVDKDHMIKAAFIIWKKDDSTPSKEQPKKGTWIDELGFERSGE